MNIQAPKGTRDILPLEIIKWRYIEGIIDKLCKYYGYRELRIPVFEYTELFQRGVGDTTDIVQKEMYTFEDKGGRSITLRPEGTAGVVRSYIQNGMASLPQPVKLYYNITAYRYENVQKGRYREFNQFGVEAFGADGPSIDVEIISILDDLFGKLGLKGIKLNINSLGCSECRKKYNKELVDYLRPKLKGLCHICNDRFERNPLRIIDCKEKKCGIILKDAPALADKLCDGCNEHFEGLKNGLVNLNINYNVDKNIVRGLDYYTRTVFEFVSENVGTQGTVCGGGRYDNLIVAFGGKPTPGIGFGLGMERLFMEIDSQGLVIPGNAETDIFVVSIGKKAELYTQKLVKQLRGKGVIAEKDHMGRSVRAQLKYANKLGAKYTVVIGDTEVESNKAVLKDMNTGEEKDVSLDSIPERMKT